MGHTLEIGEESRRWIVHRSTRLPMEGVVLQGAAVDEPPPIRQHHHSVAEHVPSNGLSGHRAGLRIENASLKIRVGGDIARTRDDQNLAVMHERDVYWIDRHEVRQGLP